jgi:hypothetical protein
MWKEGMIQKKYVGFCVSRIYVSYLLKLGRKIKYCVHWTWKLKVFAKGGVNVHK